MLPDQTTDRPFPSHDTGAGRKHYATCHPARLAFVEYTCRECYQVAQGVALSEAGPPLFFDVDQCASTTLPVCCPKCYTQPPAWRIDPDDRYATCLMCGTDRFLSSGRLSSVHAITIYPGGRQERGRP